ncbi:tol-pal system YbgF family protein [candidate division KSB1 bacterium]
MKAKLSLMIILILGMTFVLSCGEKMTEDEMAQLALDYQSKDQPKEAIKIYEKLLKEFPESPEAGNHMFLIGFLYANVINDFEKAKEYYTKFKEKYPNHEFVKNNTVDFELENMGKDIIIPEDESKPKEEDKK